MRRFLLWITVYLIIAAESHGQSGADTVRLLKEVTVQAYASDRPLNEVAAAIGTVKAENLNRFGNTSFVPVFNALPGVRMEERSPGSYRFSIRGSMLRSPFGVRNVKFYWNGLPLTDGGGNTYLNLLDFSSLGNAEVIKGPAGSLYGAGTGGVVLLNTPLVAQSQVQLSAQTGSYEMQRLQILAETKSENVLSSMRYVHHQSDGYRDQSSLRRDAVNADMSFLIDADNTLSTTIFYTDLSYQTPGGLTLAQYDAAPRQARPASTTLPGAVEQQAAVYNKTFYGGVSYQHEWSEGWSSRVGVFSSTTDFKNPSIRNYETRSERNLGARTENQYKFDRTGWKGKFTFGGEFQRLASPILVTDNDKGAPGTQIFSRDDITSLLALGFAQAELDLPKQFFLTLGGSLNYLQYEDKRLAVNPVEIDVRKFNPVFSPRIALLKKFSPDFSAYLSVSKGFSPPSVAEVIPSTGVYNPGLNPETGWSYEAGARGNIFNTLAFTMALYSFHLRETIVIQRDANGADYFVNAGSTLQRGVEFSLAWSRTFASTSLRFWTSLTFSNYRFGDYVNDGNDYSGNKLTGVTPLIFVLGGDVIVQKGLYVSLTGTYTGRMPLNDANTDFASHSVLLGTRLGYKVSKKFPLEFFAGVDNALDQRYSLGNDLNATGGRYYNAAPGRNYYGGVIAKIFTGAK